MEIIIIIAVLGLAAYWVYDMSQKKQDTTSDQPWPYGEKLPEGKIHVKSADVAPGKSADDRVEATPPKCGCGRSTTGFCVGLHKLTAEEWAVSNKNPNRVTSVAVEAITTVVENKPAKKPATKKGAHEGNKAPAKAPAKKPAAKKKSV